MKKAMLTSFILGLSVLPALGADPVPPGIPPANVAGPNGTTTSPPFTADESERVVVPLRTLTVVMDARERRTPWQQSADEAVARINDPAIKANVTQQLAAIAPQVAKALMQQPAETAVVTVAVYKHRGGDKDILAAVAFEGVGEGLNPSFYARVQANFPQVPGADPKLAERLEFDPLASSYLCMFVNRGELKADDVTDAQMKKSLDLGIEQAQTSGNVVGGTAPQSQAGLTRQQIDQIGQQEAAIEQSQQGDTYQGPDYTTPYWDDTTADSVPYYGVDGWIPWFTYVPTNGQSALIARPDFQHREHWIRHHETGSAERHDSTSALQHPDNSVIGSAHAPAQNKHWLILPSNGRNARPAAGVPVARPTSPAPVQGAHEPGPAPHAAPVPEAPAGRK